MSKVKWDYIDPEEVDDRALDYSDRLPPTDTILTSIWTVKAPGGIDCVHYAIEGLITRAMLSNGTLEAPVKEYEILNHLTTQSGRELEQSVFIKVKPR